jgi:hypothetical protein
MPALGASDDARERAYVAGIHVFFYVKVKNVDGTGTRAWPPHPTGNRRAIVLRFRRFAN